MYPRNAASPERIAVGPVVQISDGAVQTSGVSIKVMPQGGSASAGGGTPDYVEGIVHYIPTQAETNYTSFMVIAYKTGCIPASVTVVTSAMPTAGQVYVGTNNDKTGYGLADDAITAAKFDESTAFPLKSADTGATAVLRTGADSDTGETLSDQMDALATAAELAKVPKSDSNVTWNATALGSIQSKCNDALVAIHLDHLLAEDYDPSSKPGTATALLNELVENDGGVSRFTVNALENAPSGSGASAETIADAVLDELLSGHTGAGSLGKALTDVLADTNELQTDWANGGRLDLILDARASQTSVDTIDGIVDDILVDTGTTLPSTLTTMDGKLDTIDNFLDTEIAAILEDTGTTLNTHLTDIKGATFNGATDSLEAIRDRGDAAWVTATGFSTLDAAGVRSALGMATNNLDTQLDALPTAAEIKTAMEAAGGHLALILEDTGTTLNGKIDTIDGIVDDILTDTGTTLDTALEVIKRAVVYKKILTFDGDDEGNLELFASNGSSLGTIVDAFTGDATTKTQKALIAP